MKHELLAPAGDIERLKWALIYGADAVYFGGYDYSLRANANNFSIEEIKEACDFAHKLNKKVYVTVNMIFHNEDLECLKNYLLELVKCKVDAIIVSDFSVIKYLKDNKIKLPFIISTQMSVTNYETAKFYKELGAFRVVLARECSKDDIKQIKEKVDIELEIFIHGAMCTSYSGRCVMSNYITQRDSNRGGCSQVCRFSFDMEGLSDEYSMASKDLNMVDYIRELIDLGVESFKIEGRMKSVYYIATVCNAYKNIIEKSLNKTLTKEDIDYYKKVLNRCSNRDNIPQFFDRLPGIEGQYYSGRKEISNQDFLGVVKDYNKQTSSMTIEQRNYFKVGDEIEIFGPNNSPKKFKVEYIKNKSGELVSSANHAQETLEINVPFEVCAYDIIRVNIS